MHKVVVFTSEKCLLHDPGYELYQGKWVRWWECPDRLRALIASMKGFEMYYSEIEQLPSRDLHYITKCHDRAYVDYLRTAYETWCSLGGDESGVICEQYLHKDLLPVNHIAPTKYDFFGTVAKHHFDLTSTITKDTYISVINACHATLKAAEYIVANDSNQQNVSFAAVRPPGHHATTSLCGGYCYLNNAAIAAAFIANLSSHNKVLILDLDFHHGNGTYEIMQHNDEWRQRCKYVSLHCADDYPYFTSHLDHSIPKDTTLDDYLHHLDSIETVPYNYCIVSLGMDNFARDPIAGFPCFESPSDFEYLGNRLAKKLAHCAGVVFVMEGGYHLEKLGYITWIFLKSYLEHLDRTFR